MKQQMEQMMFYLRMSMVYQMFENFSKHIATQWKESRVITAFLTPASWEQEVGRQSVFFKLWLAVRGLLTGIYEKLRLEKLFGGSVFTLSYFWGILVAALAPFLPTMGVLALAMLTGCSLLLNFVRDREKTLLYAPMNRFILLYAVLYLCLSFVSPAASSSIPVALLSSALILFALVLQNAVQSKRGIYFLLGAFSIVGAFVALYGMFQYVFRSGYQSAAWVDSEMFNSISFRVASSLDNPNMLGQYFILVIPVTGALLLSAKTWAERVVWLGCAGLQCICMILTFSRGAWLGLLFAGALFFIFLNPKLIYLIPVALMTLYFVLPTAVIERFTSIGDLSDDSTSYRVYIWLGVLAMLKDYWFCGIGPGEEAFNLVYPAYSYSAIVAPHSHNLLLQILCDGGFFLLIIFCCILFHYFRSLCVALKHSETTEGRLYQIAAGSAVAGFMVQAMTDYSFYNYRVMFLFWMMLGLGGLVSNYDRLPSRENFSLYGISEEKSK